MQGLSSAFTAALATRIAGSYAEGEYLLKLWVKVFAMDYRYPGGFSGTASETCSST